MPHQQKSESNHHPWLWSLRDLFLLLYSFLKGFVQSAVPVRKNKRWVHFQSGLAGRSPLTYGLSPPQSRAWSCGNISHASCMQRWKHLHGSSKATPARHHSPEAQDREQRGSVPCIGASSDFGPQTTVPDHHLLVSKSRFLKSQPYCLHTCSW